MYINNLLVNGVNTNSVIKNISTQPDQNMEENLVTNDNLESSLAISMDGIHRMLQMRFEHINRDGGNEIENYAKRYAEAKKDILENFDHQDLYLKELDQVYNETIKAASQKSAGEIEDFLKIVPESSSLFKKDEFVNTYQDLANKLKEVIDLNLPGIEAKDLFVGNSNFDHFEDFKLAIEIGYRKQEMKKSILNSASKIMNADNRSIIHDELAYNKLMNSVKQVFDEKSEWDQLEESVRSSGLSGTMKDAFKKAYERTNNQFKGAVTQIGLYSKYIEEYKLLDEQLAKLKGQFEKFSKRAQAFVEAHDIERAADFNARAMEIQTQIAEIEAKKIQLETKMSNAQSKLKDTVISL